MTKLSAQAALDFARSGERFVSITGEVNANRVGVATDWSTGSGDALKSAAGDWEVNDGTTTWYVAADVFAATYEKLAPGRFAKTAIVMARPLAADADPTQIPTREGAITLSAGDWVVANPDGDVWGMDEKSFRDRYQLA